MPFLRRQHKQRNKSTAHSLRANLDIHRDGHIYHSFLSYIWANYMPSKRVSPFAFLQKKASASITLEAAFALPFFLLAMINIIFVMNIIGTQSRINAALHQTGNKMAFAAYLTEGIAGGGAGGELAGVVLSGIYAKNQILEYTGREYIDRSCVKDGSGGISMLGSKVMETGDVVDLQVSYQVKPFSGIMGFDGFRVRQRYYGRAWTGYDVEQFAGEQSDEDPMVYITETGTVYHVSGNCSYLNPTVHRVAAAEIKSRRNASGAIYHSCEKCGTGVTLTTYYVTEQGNRYHSNLNCSGLKRTIYTVPLSQVGGRGRCSKCG